MKIFYLKKMSDLGDCPTCGDFKYDWKSISERSHRDIGAELNKPSSSTYPSMQPDLSQNTYKYDYDYYPQTSYDTRTYKDSLYEYYSRLQNPYQNSYQNSYQNPYQNPYQNSYQNSYQNPYQNPYQNFYQNFYQNPYQTQYQDPYQTQYQDPHQGQYQNPYQTQYQDPHQGQYQNSYN